MVDWDNPLIKNIPNILGIIFLLFVLAFLLAKFGYVRACDIPGFGDIYYSIDGYPNVAIVYEQDVQGEFTVGNPTMLENSLIQRKNVFPAMIPIETIVSANLLDNYKVIFVEAKNIDTATLERFRNFVNSGGKLVWVGDSGTGLAENDYMCQKVTFKYLPAYKTQTYPCESLTGEEKEKCDAGQCDLLEGQAKILCESKRSGAQCADSWYEHTPNVPSDIEGGICGQTFGEVVANFYEEKTDIYSKVTSGNLELCDPKEDSFKVENAKNIEQCIDLLENRINLDESSKRDIASNATEMCNYNSGFYNYGVNYWSRGPTETLTGEYVPAVNFANVLGIDYIQESEPTTLTLLPVDTNHPLTTGYGTKTYFGTAPLTRVSVAKFPIRSNVIMSVCMRNDCKNNAWPAIIVSNPTGPSISKSGLVVYFAFPPESGLETSTTGGGANFINNLVDYSICA